jgi:hypothetical protein
MGAETLVVMNSALTDTGGHSIMTRQADSSVSVRTLLTKQHHIDLSLFCRSGPTHGLTGCYGQGCEPQSLTKVLLAADRHMKARQVLCQGHVSACLILTTAGRGHTCGATRYAPADCQTNGGKRSCCWHTKRAIGEKQGVPENCSQ